MRSGRENIVMIWKIVKKLTGNGEYSRLFRIVIGIPKGYVGFRISMTDTREKKPK